MTKTESKPNKEPVNRGRRSKFIFWLVGCCVGFNAAVAVASGLDLIASTELLTLVVGGFNTLALTATIAYVGGSTLDYNGGVAGIIRRPNDLPSQTYAGPSSVRHNINDGVMG